MTNFANWFAYYRTRMLMMKTAAGLAFAPIDAATGWASHHQPGRRPRRAQRPSSSQIDKFIAVHKQKWYDMFYKQNTRIGGTPLPEALSRAGRHFAGKKDGINNGMDDDPMQYSCQQNFTIMTTDGYWNGFDGKKLDGKQRWTTRTTTPHRRRARYGTAPRTAAAQDPDGSSTDLQRQGHAGRRRAVLLPNRPASTGSKARWAPTCRRTTCPTSKTPGDQLDQKTPNTQHMVTFGLGMAEGLMDWRPDYDSADATGDFDNVRKGASNACSWITGACNWPCPAIRRPAQPGRPVARRGERARQVLLGPRHQGGAGGPDGALTSLQERSASGAAAATCTPEHHADGPRHLQDLLHDRRSGTGRSSRS